MFIIDFRNKNVSEYHFSVIGNANVDLVHFYSNFSQYASGTSIYLKVRSHDEDYVDKIAIASENVSVEDSALLCKWTMGKVSTQCKKLYLQLQFEKDDGEIIAQTGIVSLKLGDTIDVSQEIEPIYPDILKSLQDQIDTLKADSYALATMGYANDILTLVFKNKENQTLTSLQVSIPISDKVQAIEVNEGLTIEQAYNLAGNKPFIDYNNRIIQMNYDNGNETYTIHVVTPNGYGFGMTDNGESSLDSFIGDSIDYAYYVTSENIDNYINGKVDKTGSSNKVYATDDNGEQITIDVDYGITNEGKIVRRSGSSGEANQIYVPLAPTQNGHATSKYYVDNLVSSILRDSYKPVDTTTYPTLNDFLASTGEEGYMYLYPIDTSDLTKGYYRYIWENGAWVDLGTTKIDLSGYYAKNQSLIPDTANTYDLGSSTYTFKDLYLGGEIKLKNPDSSGGSFKIWESSYGRLLFYKDTTEAVEMQPGSNLIVNGNVMPRGNNNRDLGISTYKWKDLYLAGTAYTTKIESATNILFRINGNDRYYFDDNAIYPNNNTLKDLGRIGNKWRDLYLSNNLSDGTNAFTIAHAYKILDGVTNSTALSFETILEASVSADTSYTFPVISAGTQPEAKAIITNSGASTITLTFENVSKCLCNDDNVVITSTENALTHTWTTTITMGAGVTYEISIVAGKMVVVNFEAQ